jgi:ABC-2 type transport system permease protein
MTANPALQLNPARERGWLDGFANLFRNENAAWWRTRRWIIHVILWTVLVNGMLASVLWAPQPPSSAQAQNPAGPDTTNPLVLGTLLFVVVGGLATCTGAIILMQGAVIDEKKSGTAEWILSKPVSRSAFIWAKLCANGLAALLIMIVLQGMVAYLLISARLGSAPPLVPFASGIALLGLNLLFYLSLTLMLGTLFDGRGPVLAIPLGILFGAQIWMGLAPWLVQFMPWTIIIPAGQNTLALAMLAMQGQPLPTTTPILATAIWIVIFVGVALWRFGREEF